MKRPTENEPGEMSQLFLQVEELRKEYTSGELVTRALDGIDLEIHRGDFRLILGPSGCGKTTLLNLLGGLSTPTSGRILVRTNGNLQDLSSLSKKALTNYRRYTVGIIFQFYNIVPILTALENVELAARLAGKKKPHQKSLSALSVVGLEGKEDRYPAQMSGGEQQRVAIARVLVKEPRLILADEPTGNLDSVRSHEIYVLLEKISRDFNSAVLVVTHDNTIAETYGKNHIHILDGKLVED